MLGDRGKIGSSLLVISSRFEVCFCFNDGFYWVLVVVFFERMYGFFFIV